MLLVFLCPVLAYTFVAFGSAVVVAALVAVPVVGGAVVVVAVVVVAAAAVVADACDAVAVVGAAHVPLHAPVPVPAYSSSVSCCSSCWRCGWC